MRNIWWVKTSRIIGIVFMSLTALFTLLGGVGTTCVALNPTGFGGAFSSIAPFKWLWLIFVLVGIIAGVLGVRAVVMLIKENKNAYRCTLIALYLGTVINAIHLVASRLLRGGSMPVDLVLSVNLLTLIIFMIFRLPGIWNGIKFMKPEGEDKTGRQAASIAFATCGLLSLTIQFMMAPTHTFNDVNYADVWHTTLTALGTGLLLAAIVNLFIQKSTPLDQPLQEITI